MMRQVSDVLKRILVPVDGSPAAARAIQVACALAREHGGELVFGDAVNHAAAIAELTVPYGIPDATPLLQALDDAAGGVCADAVKLAQAAGLSASSVVLEGQAAGAVVDYASAHGIDAIVMGTRGARGLERFFTGSTADGVLRTSDVPTFVVQAVEHAAEPTFKRVLVAVDDSEASAAAVAYALQLLGKAGTALFLHVIPTADLGEKSREYGYDPRPMLDEFRAAAQPFLDAATAQAKALELSSETYVEEGDAVEEILSAATAHGADAIALGTHGRSGLPRLFLGSVAEGVVSRSAVPVVVLRR
jgi:nucleotide-binding universal stress UspA family protein